MTRRLQFVTWGSVIGMFLVLLMGALVTKTGSAEGCGDTWPLCDGEFLPQLQPGPIIEFSHRIVSGLVGILIIVMAVMVWRRYKQHPEIRLFIPLAVGFLLLQAWLGAMAVMWPQPKLVLALHFGISLIAFSSVLLPTIFIRQIENNDTHRTVTVSQRLQRYVWFVTAYIYVVTYTGAYVRHTGSDLACLDFPLCNGQLIPPLQGAVGIHFTHRLAAYAGLALLFGLWMYTRRWKEQRPDIARASFWAFITGLAQAASGAMSVLTQLALASMMLHSAIIIVLFGLLSYISLQVVAEPRRVALTKSASGDAVPVS